jgi:hypothetical protein
MPSADARLNFFVDNEDARDEASNRSNGFREPHNRDIRGRRHAGLHLGPAGYVNSLSRVQAKGSPKEQDSAAKQAEWLDDNQRQVKELMQWLYLNHKLKVSPD